MQSAVESSQASLYLSSTCPVQEYNNEIASPGLMLQRTFWCSGGIRPGVTRETPNLLQGHKRRTKSKCWELKGIAECVYPHINMKSTVEEGVAR